ncbi:MULTISPECIES: phosphotransferase [Actinosynnema]|uniref:phosphotransferase n=1 Tax=Actinosynnema TaxID=40566 RepID=UPI0020A3A0ED|nr:phosphotransferase [Actinosynnema pretiosum]MCP2092245.1 putative kinase, aminoglycoside phosphotransferase (APT) family [Actinosynnema pretiosum]
MSGSGRWETTAELVRALVAEAHPDLAGAPVRRVESGWANQVWRLGEDLAVRLPVLETSPALPAKEFRWLPGLAPLLPLAVPTPLRFTGPSARFPRPWSVVTWVPGTPADTGELTAPTESATALAAFLRALNRPAPPDAPDNPSRRAPLSARSGDFAAYLERVGDEVDPVALHRIWADAVEAPEWRGPEVWLHGDLHPANVVTDGGLLTGVVDFGELCAGDPAVDLSAAWKLLPQQVIPGFLALCPHGDEATVRRARGWALLSGLLMVSVGRAWTRGEPGGQPTWGAAGRRTLRRLRGLPDR